MSGEEGGSRTLGNVCLSGESVLLREFTPYDVDVVAAIIGDERVTYWLSFDRRDRGDAARMIDSARAASEKVPRTEFYLAIAEPSCNEAVGFIRLAFGGVRAAKLGYAVHADHWGNGYAGAAVRLIVTFGFEILGLHRITAAVGPENLRSVAVLERAGFIAEGHLRDHVFTNGSWRDSDLFSLLASDTKPDRNAGL